MKSNSQILYIYNCIYIHNTLWNQIHKFCSHNSINNNNINTKSNSTIFAFFHYHHHHELKKKERGTERERERKRENSYSKEWIARRRFVCQGRPRERKRVNCVAVLQNKYPEKSIFSHLRFCYYHPLILFLSYVVVSTKEAIVVEIHNPSVDIDNPPLLCCGFCKRGYIGCCCCWISGFVVVVIVGFWFGEEEKKIRYGLVYYPP